MTESQGAVSIEVPAHANFVAVLRAATAVIASRLEFTLDDIDDLRILIDEAASLLLTAGAEETLHCVIEGTEDTVHFRLSGKISSGETKLEAGFAWSILQALAQEVTTKTDGSVQTIEVARRRGFVLDSAP
jgi:serine/threonine-protein kinase RsbW